MNLIEQDNQTHLQRFQKGPPHPSYIAGFIDGDGCIFIRKIAQGYQSGIAITQCRTNILQILRYHFGGTITSSSNRNNKTENIMNNNYYDKYTQRNQYNISIRGKESTLLTEYIKHSIVIKNTQLDCLCQFLKIVNLQQKTKEKEELYKICSDYNKHVLLNTLAFHNINISYIAGLFDAEGCIYIRLSKFYISITQKNNPDVLIYISNLLGIGKIDCENKFKIYKQSDCLHFIRMIKEYIIVKYNQVVAFETYLTSNDPIIKEQMYAICNKEKHEIEQFFDLNQNPNGKDGYLETMQFKNVEQICNKQVYIEKSEKMKGSGNHNFGKTFSEETRQKMSSSIRQAKGGVSDEVIVKVRQLIHDGHKNIEIQQMLDLPRHVVTRIKNGTTVCRNEEKTDTQRLTQIEVNLSKRKILTNEILIVIEKYIEKWKPLQILDYLIEERTKTNIPNNITIDIIKNIKRNLNNDKPVIYENELTKENYEYYISLITKYKQM